MYPCGRKKDFSSSSGLLLDEDATETVGRKPDKFLISDQASIALSRLKSLY